MATWKASIGTQVNFEQAFLRLAAGAALLSAVTTFFLWYLARQVPGAESFDDAARLHANGPFMARQWVNLFHIPLALLAYIGITRAVSPQARGWALGGLVFFVIWGVVEMAGVAINIFALNGTLRPAYLAAEPDSAAILAANITALTAVWNALFFVILIGFLFGTLLQGIALLADAGRFQLAIAWLMLAAAPLTLVIILSGYFEMSGLDPLISAVYPILQPISRAALGVWLWWIASAAVTPEKR
ncbi:hypothetical protein [Parasphingopyxis sp.]|uniref:hypothetical protein n=1 Tax=Parasphingopyxis sp. TaxID=1920299 RepID=UPI002629A964|nr:hypothetical protein [Parasphingopyxis sp.]